MILGELGITSIEYSAHCRKNIFLKKMRDSEKVVEIRALRNLITLQFFSERRS